jgi:hypothetical protein
MQVHSKLCTVTGCRNRNWTKGYITVSYFWTLDFPKLAHLTCPEAAEAGSVFWVTFVPRKYQVIGAIPEPNVSFTRVHVDYYTARSETAFLYHTLRIFITAQNVLIETFSRCVLVKNVYK